MSFETRLAQAAARVQARLIAALDPLADQPVIHAMRYGVQGGKCLRGFLVLESAALHGLDPDRALAAAAAIEALHAYSLIHDDLPAMDDDDLRRGQPTVHVKWDEATAILAGDALQSLAFELLCDPALGDVEPHGALAHAFDQLRLDERAHRCKHLIFDRDSGNPILHRLESG